MTELEQAWVEETKRWASNVDLADPDRTVLEDIIITGLHGKAGMTGLLGLQEANQYRLLIPITETEEQAQARLAPLVKFIAALENWQEVQVELTANRYSTDGGRNWRKITRTVAAQASTLLDATSLSAHKQTAKDLLWHLMNDHEMTAINAASKLGELLSAKQQVGVVSANWLDFIMASYNAGFSSCYQPCAPDSRDTNHFNGCIANYLDGYTLITYLTDYQSTRDIRPARKNGRAWVQVHAGDLPYVIWGRQYGSWTTHAASTVREPILKALRELYGVDRPRWVRIDPDDAYVATVRQSKAHNHMDYPGYHDSAHWTVYQLRGHEYPERRVWVWSAAVCWCCGEATDYSKGGCCRECSGYTEYYCTDCDTDLDEEQVWRAADGDIFCHDCYRERYVDCNNCGDETAWDDAYEAGDYYYCEHCHGELFTRCDDCDRYRYNDDMTETSTGRVVCDACLNRNYFHCDDCGNWVPLDHHNTHNGDNYCDDCYSTIANDDEEVQHEAV